VPELEKIILQLKQQVVELSVKRKILILANPFSNMRMVRMKKGRR
jgi:hypothetical protein